MPTAMGKCAGAFNLGFRGSGPPIYYSGVVRLVPE